MTQFFLVSCIFCVIICVLNLLITVSSFDSVQGSYEEVLQNSVISGESEQNDDSKEGGKTLDENKVPVFPNPLIITSSPTPSKVNRNRHNKNIRKKNEDVEEMLSWLNLKDYPFTTNKNNPRNVKKKRLMRFLRNFRLDFTKFDTSCVKREGRSLVAPPVAHARVVKYIRRRNKERPRNPYAMALYECLEGYEFPEESADRMFCSKNKWVGPTPVCLPKGSLDESECQKCDQICSADQETSGLPRISCSCYAGYEMLFNGSCADIDECSKDNGGCSEICFNKPGSFQCFCPSGYRVGPDGKTCIDRNECLLRNGHGPCQDTCENTPGSYLCSCENINGTRLSGDKHSCEDINECDELNNFGCSHMCLNTFGNAFCACPKGLSLSSEDYKTCLGDLDEVTTTLAPENLEIPTTLPPPPPPIPLECPPGSAPAYHEDNTDTDNPSQICVEHEDCSVENGGCEHDCITSGSFRFCSCREGYELRNETSCVDQNECSLGNGGCDQECINLLGSHYCACKEGYKLAADQKTCQVTFCEPPPIRENTIGWECEYPSLVAFVNGDNPLIGTKCHLTCLPGYSLGYLYDNNDHHDKSNHLLHNSILVGADSDNSVFSGHHAKSIICAEDGEWKGLQAISKYTCVSTSCPSLPAPEHGTIFPETCLSDHVPLNSQCLVICNSGFYPKNGKIRTCSRGFHWFPEDNPLCIKLPPTPRPYIHCPSDIIVDLKPGQGTAYVNLPQPQANMDWHRYVEAVPSWAKSLEWDASPGITQLTFIARSPVSNDTATCQFKIHVRDREAPRVHGCPTSFEIRLYSGEGSREVWWAEPKFSDNVNLKYVQQSHTPGHALSRGNHHISYLAGDAEGNKARCSFTVSVHGAEDYLVDRSAEDYLVDRSADYAYLTSRPAASSASNNIMVICPNFKTGRWIIHHYAFYVPPGCRYSPSQSPSSSSTPPSYQNHGYYSPSKFYGKQHKYPNYYSNHISSRFRRKTWPNYYYSK